MIAEQANLFDSQVTSILHYFRDLELFLPFHLDTVFNQYSGTILLHRGGTEPLPWEQPASYHLDGEKKWGFDIFFAPFLLSEVPRLLAEWIPGITAESMPDPRRYEGQSAWLRCSVGSAGDVLSDRISISTLPWALAQSLAGRSRSVQDFDAFAEEITVQLLGDVGPSLANDLMALTAPRPLSRQQLEDLVAFLESASPVVLCPNNLMAVIVAHSLGPKKIEQASGESDPDESIGEQAPALGREPPEAATMAKRRRVDILNSFYLRDLERVAAYTSKSMLGGTLDTPLRSYLTSRASGLSNRVDVRTPQVTEEAVELLHPKNSPLGSWPTPCDRPLALHQAFALRSYLFGRQSLVAVNGPPGTGKTSLVRDVLAHLVVARGLELAKLTKPADAFEPTYCELRIGKRTYLHRKLRPELCGYECVVVSANNSAVENISRELPRVESIGLEFTGLTYLEPVAALLHRLHSERSTKITTPPWGLPSIALGRSSNRRLFRRAAFSYAYEETEEQRTNRRILGKELTLFEWRQRADSEAISFHRARSELRSCHREFMAWQELACSKADFIRDEVAASIQSRESQLYGVFYDPEGELLRRRLFIAALRLQEAWLREVPNFERELWAISGFLRSPSGVHEGSANSVFQLLSMVVPLISSTLASVERMFACISPGAIGHVIIDEAGQAVPQSALGILMRARRALSMGDQRQLEPVVIIPDALEVRLRGGLEPDIVRHMSPIRSSVQTVADATSRLGTLLSTESDSQLWVGTPLCVHRRSGSPMFDISNHIAYDGMMIQAAESSPAHPQLGPSAWRQVTGRVTVRQWVPEHGDEALTICRSLLTNSSELPDIFFITPFREVAARLRAMLKRELRPILSSTSLQQLDRRIGTVHTFQGKEADIVVFVLGCDFSTGGAADWAGERPNLVNVAVTRARRWIYVIGDRNVWHNRGYFSDLEKALR